ncbi:K02A2.6-like [Cordylochernes scorpioides]|uniref:RNA-directed DNA polymerase n=1 Tax=Cordylochernes scorpioides TaxID=51811 RepID=A0ABY6L8M1_9ARAC|nr:K02A2.6-like [Cordylochernes scorpioides]
MLQWPPILAKDQPYQRVQITRREALAHLVFQYLSAPWKTFKSSHKIQAVVVETEWKVWDVHTKNEDTVALRKFRKQIKVEPGAKDGDRRVLTSLHALPCRPPKDLQEPPLKWISFPLAVSLGLTTGVGTRETYQKSTYTRQYYTWKLRIATGTLERDAVGAAGEIDDSRPLNILMTTTFNAHFFTKKPILICAASRIKRWSLKLAAFKYTVEFRKTGDNGNADALSRLPLDSKTTESLDEDQVLLLRKMSEVPFSFQDMAVETRRDRLLSIVLRNVRENNWQISKVSQENPLYPYYRIKDELSCEFGCLQWRERVAIPQKLRSLILDDLHEMHLGMVNMKMIARRYFWWPGIDKNIEELARDCRICQESASMSPSTISEWTWPEKPWHRLHLDLASPFMGRMFMVLVDAYTKWLEIVIIKDITSRTIIGHLREIFARFGLPEILVTDNGRQFVSSEFEEFTKMNGIRHTKTSPYNPSTNGLAERYVREFKNSLRKNQGKDSIEINLQRFLFTHRAFSQTVLKESPAELLMKRILRSRFLNLFPKMAKVGEVYHDAVRKQKHFSVGSDVIMELLSSRHYLIEDEGRYVKRHINHLRPVIKKEVPEVRDLVLPGTSRDFILPGTSRDHPRLGGQEKKMEKPRRSFSGAYLTMLRTDNRGPIFQAYNYHRKIGEEWTSEIGLTMEIGRRLLLLHNLHAAPINLAIKGQSDVIPTRHDNAIGIDSGFRSLLTVPLSHMEALKHMFQVR